VQPSLLKIKLADGARHPLLRALLGDGERIERVFDATLGLGADAMHVACVLGCELVGTEASPVLFSLLEEGLARLARDRPALSRIVAKNALAEDELARLPNDAFDVVMLDPMMSRPKRATPSFTLLRDFARSSTRRCASRAVAWSSSSARARRCRRTRRTRFRASRRAARCATGCMTRADAVSPARAPSDPGRRRSRAGR
jgi:hypothetical protein